MSSAPAAAPAISHADLAGLWVSAGSERDGHQPGCERYHFPVAGTLWIERLGAPLACYAYQLDGETLRLQAGDQQGELAVLIEAGHLIVRGSDECETWCRPLRP